MKKIVLKTWSEFMNNLRHKDIEGITIRYFDGEEDSTNDTHINDYVCDAFMEVIDRYKKLKQKKK